MVGSIGAAVLKYRSSSPRLHRAYLIDRAKVKRIHVKKQIYFVSIVRERHISSASMNKIVRARNRR